MIIKKRFIDLVVELFKAILYVLLGWLGHTVV